MTEVTVEVRVDARSVEAMMERVNTALSSAALVEFLTGEVVPWLNERGKSRFASEGDEVSGKWAPLQFTTQRIRMEGAQRGQWDVGPDHPINVRTHELEDYITGTIGYTVPTTLGATLTFPDPKKLTPELKKKMEAAQRGLSDPKTPARPVLGLGEADLAWVLERLAVHVTGNDKAAAAVEAAMA